MANEEKSVVEDLMKIKGIAGLWDSQRKALETGLLSTDRSFVIIAPTASGKTLNAEFAMLQTLRRNGRCLYLVPLTVLQTEKGEEFSYLHDLYNYRISTKGEWKGAHVVITTFENFYKASLLNRSIVENFNTAVVDEFHILYDQNRGFNLEKAITMLKELDIRIICLSATFENKNEIQSWLDSELIVGEKRAVPLETGFLDLTKFPGGERMTRLYTWLVESEEKHPVLIFCSTRDRTRSRALALCNLAKESVDDPTIVRKEMEQAISRTNFTSLEEDLYTCLCKKIAFHHSGLDRRLREFIVDKFKSEEVKFLLATTGLAYGINFPSKTVVLSELTMYREGKIIDVPVYLFLQMAGRAGRPQFGDKGYAYAVLTTEADIRRAQKLIGGELENATSHIFVDDLFKRAILELVYSGKREEKEIVSFFENTFYNYQSIRREGLVEFDLGDILRRRLKELIDQGFVEFLGAPGYRLTDLGIVTMQFLFETFRMYTLEAFMKMNDYLTKQREVKADFNTIHRLSKEFEGARTYKIPRQKSERIEEFYSLRGITKPSHAEYSAYSIFYGWIENKPEYEIEEEFKVYASALKNVADEMCKILTTYERLANRKRLTVPPGFQVLKDRIEHGVREEEIPFVKLRGFRRDSVRKLCSWCNAVLRRPPYRYTGDMLHVLIRFYEDKNRDDNFLLSTLADGIKNVGPVRAQKIVDLVKSCIS
jgi:helicase